MKKDTHPTTYMAKVTCNSCSTEFIVLSTLESFDIEVCSNCHPFYTGDQRIMDTAGRADKFKKRMEKAAAMSGGKKTTKKKEAPKTKAQEETNAEA